MGTDSTSHRNNYNTPVNRYQLKGQPDPGVLASGPIVESSGVQVDGAPIAPVGRPERRMRRAVQHRHLGPGQAAGIGVEIRAGSTGPVGFAPRPLVRIHPSHETPPAILLAPDSPRTPGPAAPRRPRPHPSPGRPGDLF